MTFGERGKKESIFQVDGRVNLDGGEERKGWGLVQ